MRVPPPLIYVAGFLLGVALEAVVPVAGVSTGLAVAVGVACGALWLALDGTAMRAFIRVKTGIPPNSPTTALVTRGPYRVSRNPMYLGMAVLYAGLAVAFGVIWALAFLVVVLVVVDRGVIAREERWLEAQFGEEYRAYKRRVRRWL